LIDNLSVISADNLRAWVRRVLIRAAVPDDEAATAADVLVSANLRGVDSHGVLQLPHKARRVLKGVINPRPNVRIERDSPAALLVNGDNGLGMVVGVCAVRRAIERAREYGIGVVGVRGSNHFGAAAYYAQLASSAGLIGISATNSSATMARGAA